MIHNKHYEYIFINTSIATQNIRVCPNINLKLN